MGNSDGSTQQILSFKVTNFNIVAATIGGFLSIFGLVSYLLKESLYMSEPLISLIWGIIFSPHAANLIRPSDYALGSPEILDSITLYFTRFVLCVQLVIAGIQLPSKYLKTERKSLATLLGPGMCIMWMITSLIVWGLVPNITILEALATGACVTPTDPVLSNSIVKGQFADENIPKELQRIIVAESGANDGLGYPFLFLALYLFKYVQGGGAGTSGGASKAMGYWFGITWGYEIIMSVLWGTLIGFLYNRALHWAESRKYVDRESFLVFAISIALFITGTVGMVGSDDVLASFIAGNVFNWDDWFRSETEDDSFQATIDMLLNVAIFLWYGAVAPWYEFAHNSVIPIYRLIFIGVLVLLFRRLPMVYLVRKQVHQIEDWRHLFFAGFFGPIGVSAIFYLYTSLEYLADIEVDGQQREDAAKLSEVTFVVVWFMAVSSIVVHGLSVPLGKFGYWFPRAMSKATSSANGILEGPMPFPLRDPDVAEEDAAERGTARRQGWRSWLSKPSATRSTYRRRSRETADAKSHPAGSANALGETPGDTSPEKDGSDGSAPTIIDQGSDATKEGLAPSKEGKRPSVSSERRSIRFPDEPAEGLLEKRSR